MLLKLSPVGLEASDIVSDALLVAAERAKQIIDNPTIGLMPFLLKSAEMIIKNRTRQIDKYDNQYLNSVLSDIPVQFEGSVFNELTLESAINSLNEQEGKYSTLLFLGPDNELVES